MTAEREQVFPEQALWCAVLQQALSDLASVNAALQQEALSFMVGPALLRVLDLAGIDRDYVPRIRVLADRQKVRQIESARKGLGTISVREAARKAGLPTVTVYQRLARGLTLEEEIRPPKFPRKARFSGTPAVESLGFPHGGTA